jgi:hypothetical protein
MSRIIVLFISTQHHQKHLDLDVFEEFLKTKYYKCAWCNYEYAVYQWL